MIEQLVAGSNFFNQRGNLCFRVFKAGAQQVNLFGMYEGLIPLDIDHHIPFRSFFCPDNFGTAVGAALVLGRSHHRRPAKFKDMIENTVVVCGNDDQGKFPAQ
jgi:hypothetical protein